MTKEDIVARVAQEVGITKRQASAALTSILGAIEDALVQGDRVTFVGFGSFFTSQRAARRGRNPQTGDEIDIPATTVPKFKPSRQLRDKV